MALTRTFVLGGVIFFVFAFGVVTGGVHQIFLTIDLACLWYDAGTDVAICRVFAGPRLCLARMVRDAASRHPWVFPPHAGICDHGMGSSDMPGDNNYFVLLHRA